jgi:outer membrane lipoprotein-sorting protein
MRKSPEFLPIAVRAFPMRSFFLARSVLALAAVAAVTFLGAAGQLPPQRLTPAYSDEQKVLLDKISAYLNGIHSLKARFIQIGPEGGTDQGTLYIQKPGQIRFEYDPPSALLIVATNGRVYVKNSRLNTLDTYDLSDTPLGLLLNQNVDLKANRAVMGVNDQNGMVTVQARTSTNRNNSNITMMFSSPGLELRQWTVRDNQGGNTTVALQNPEAGAAIDPALFTPPQKTPRTARQTPAPTSR